MSHEETDRAVEQPATTLDQSIEHGIDSLARLRGDMRQAGMTDCADVLDEAFVRCLKAFVDRRAINRPHPPNYEDDEPLGWA
jgi:hypothetical protein